MKKLLCLALTLMLVTTCFASCKKNPEDLSSAPAVSESDEFVKPQNYASVVLVTINPQFRLYLDADGVVLAVEPINDDAKSIETKISFKNQKVEAVVNNIIVAANDSGFVKEDATIDIKVASIESNDDATKILNDVKASVTAKLTEMEIEAEVTASVSVEILNLDETSSEATSSDETSSSQDDSSDKTSSLASSSNNSSSKAETQVCKHKNKNAVSVNSGKNIIDASKLDVVNHNVVCADCKAVLGLEAHKIADGKCTLCGQKNFETKTIGIVSAGPTLEGDIKINEDGSPAFEVMLDATWQQAITPEYTIDEWHYKIPADAMLKAIRTKFVITDAQFEKLKAQGEYRFFIDTHTYKDGYFNILWPAAGGPGNYTHKQVGYTDNKAGKFTVYIDYISGGADVEEHEHISYYAVEYSYSGYSNLSIEKGEWYNTILGYAPVVDSMRVTSIKMVSSLPSNMTKI